MRSFVYLYENRGISKSSHKLQAPRGPLIHNNLTDEPYCVKRKRAAFSQEVESQKPSKQYCYSESVTTTRILNEHVCVYIYIYIYVYHV